jgi:hypothetical protein
MQKNINSINFSNNSKKKISINSIRFSKKGHSFFDLHLKQQKQLLFISQQLRRRRQRVEVEKQLVVNEAKEE